MPETPEATSFTRRQAIILDQYNRLDPQHLIMEGAVRSGKTFLNNLLWMSHVARFPQPTKSFILTGRTIGSVERNVIQPMEEASGRTITLNNFNQFAWGGHKICCFGTDNENA